LKDNPGLIWVLEELVVEYDFVKFNIMGHKNSAGVDIYHMVLGQGFIWVSEQDTLVDMVIQLLLQVSMYPCISQASKDS
jgi:hypothetical protein